MSGSWRGDERIVHECDVCGARLSAKVLGHSCAVMDRDGNIRCGDWPPEPVIRQLPPVQAERIRAEAIVQQQAEPRRERIWAQVIEPQQPQIQRPVREIEASGRPALTDGRRR